MPPTIQSGSRNERDRKSTSRSTVPKRSDIVCRIKYYNQLPDIPFDPKFIKYPFEQKRFVDYNATSLERNYKHELLAEHDLGVTIDLINPETYKIDPNAVLDPRDEFLLEEEMPTKGDSKRSARHARNVSWLRKTQYISSEYTRSTPTSEKPETRVAYTLKKNFKDEDAYQDRDVQIASIQKTFEDAKKPIEKHYSKPSVTPIEILPVFPDFETWIHPCAQVNFDFDPAVRSAGGNLNNEEMSQAMIRGMVDETDEQFVGYFLPSSDTLNKRKRDVEDEVDYREEEEYEYKLTREYNWNVKNKASRGYEENYFFIFRKGKGVFFNELETRVRLSKRRKKEGLSSNSMLLVKHREFNEQELAVQEARLTQLENIQVEEEEEEEEEEAEGEEEGKEGEAEEEEQGEKQDDDEKQESGEEQGSDVEMESQEDEAEEAKDEDGEQEAEGSGQESGAEVADSDEEGAVQTADSDNEEAAGSDNEEQEMEEGEEQEEGEVEQNEEEGEEEGAEEEEEEDEDQEEEREDEDEDDEERGRKEDEAEIFGGDSDEESGAASD